MNGPTVSLPPLTPSDPTKTSVETSPLAGLRSMGTLKTAWAILLGVLLLVSFAVQWIAILGLFGTPPMDPWTLRFMGLPAAAMFIASAKYLFQ